MREGMRRAMCFMHVATDIATSMWWTGTPVIVAHGMRDRKMQRALMQFFKPGNYFMVPKIKITPAG
jgi:hypothetical protein